MALLVAFFIPARQRIVEGGKAEWQSGYMKSFEMIADGLLVSPILQVLDGYEKEHEHCCLKKDSNIADMMMMMMMNNGDGEG
mmetsp:Transcript_27346/g.44003  ORF Transcript_27346/g.44003 Transcript_27346/m.44003 type:complete len:82 (+) Transcript_27346:807-1052(+)